MYNKLFGKILDSSIWLAPDPHRLVWITLLAAMDEDGNAMFASAGNLAARARVTREQAEEAVRVFEAPDVDSGDPEYEGRRIERFPGGWHVLNAAKYRALVTKAIIREQTRVRVAKHRAGKRNCDAQVTQESRISDASVTPSVSVSVSKAEGQEIGSPAQAPVTPPAPFDGDEEGIPARAVLALAPSFALPLDWGNDSEALGWKTPEIIREAEKFKQYWTTGAGKGKRRSVKGWRQSWGNWLSKAERFKR